MGILPDPNELRPNFQGARESLIARFTGPLNWLGRYHRHSVEGIEHMPSDGRVLLAVHHSLATYDAVLLAKAIIDKTGRIPSTLGDNRIFQTPGVRRWARRAGVVPASHEHAEELLRRGQLVFVAPGGMREALRPSTERYRVRWDQRKGFVKLAIRTGTPIVLATCPAADDIYSVYETDFTKVAYKQFKMPIPLIRGFGLSLMPRPVRLTHYLSEPLVPPQANDDVMEEAVADFHAKIVARMNRLMDTGT